MLPTYAFNQQIFKNYSQHVSIFLGLEESVTNKREEGPCPWGVYAPMGKTENQQAHKKYGTDNE